MKNIVFRMLLCIFVVSINSCARPTTYTCTGQCSVCGKANETDVTICWEDYDLPSDYSDAVNIYTGQGYTCNTIKGRVVKNVSKQMLKGYGVKGFSCVED